jgi:16S rRNA (guanine966-N2)-methyltransferase
MSLRVVGGRFGGRRLEAPAGAATRPSTGRTRLAVMNILGDAVDGVSVLDLYAGTGASGIEALSRGAARAAFVERAAPALAALRANLATLGLGAAEAAVVSGDAVALLVARARFPFAPFGLVFCDPPYEAFDGGPREEALRAALGLLGPAGALAAGAILVVEHPAGGGFRCPPEGFGPGDSRAYSAAGVTLFRAL